MDAPDSTPPSHYLDWVRRGRPAIWRYLLAVVLGYLGLAFGGLPVTLWALKFAEGSPQRSILTLYSFLGTALVLLGVVRLVLGRPAYSLAVASWPPRWRGYPIAIGVGWLCLAVTYLAMSPFINIGYRGWGAGMSMGVGLFVALLVGLVIQTATEELYFRGVVQQATRRLTSWTPVVVGVQALFFAQLHIGNIKAYGTGALAATPYFVAALGFGWVAWRTGSLITSMGLHFANNSFLALFVSTEGDVLSGPAPWVAAAPTLARSSMFTGIVWVLTVAVVEVLVRRGVLGRQQQRPEPLTSQSGVTP